jgi:uncharacterized protein (DUF1697 family)
MSVVVALLRAVNVGGRGAVPMAELRAMLAALGFDDARTLLVHGNLVFRAPGMTSDAVEQLIRAAAEERFGLRTDVFVRTAAEWDKIIAKNPFPEMAANDPAHLVVMTLAKPPNAAAMRTLRERIVGRETAEAVGRALYLCYPDNIGDSKLTIAVIEKALGTTGTARNWNTTLKIQKLLQSFVKAA